MGGVPRLAREVLLEVRVRRARGGSRARRGQWGALLFTRRRSVPKTLRNFATKFATGAVRYFRLVGVFENPLPPRPRDTLPPATRGGPNFSGERSSHASRGSKNGIFSSAAPAA